MEHTRQFLMDYVEVTLHNERVILLNNLKMDIVERYNVYNDFAENYTFKSVEYINALDIAITTWEKTRLALLSELRSKVTERVRARDLLYMARGDKDKIQAHILFTRAERETIKKVDEKNEVSNTWKQLYNNYHVFNFDSYIYTKIVQYSKNKIHGLQYVEGEYTLDFIINGIYTKYLELLLNDNKLICVADADIEHKTNALIHVFALIKKSLAMLNYGTSATYNEFEHHEFSVFHGDTLTSKVVTRDTMEYGNTRAINTKHITIIDLLKQWENRNSRNERAFYTYDNGTCESNYFADDNYDIMSNLVVNSARDIVKNIIENTPDYERIKNIIQFNITDKKELMYLKRWKEKNKIETLSRDDLYYLFVMSK